MDLKSEIINSGFEYNEFYVDRYLSFIDSCVADGSVERHHILPKSMFPQYITNIDNIKPLTPRQHFIAHLMLRKVFPKSHEMQRASWYMVNTRDVKCNSRMYESIRSQNAELSAKQMSDAMSGKTTYKDTDGNRYHLSTDDPMITELRLVHISTGMSAFKDSHDNRYYLHVDDPMITELGLVHVLYGRTMDQEQVDKLRGYVTVKDSAGSGMKVSVDDPRYLSGELVQINTGTVNVVGDDGVCFKITTEEFNTGKYKHQNTGKVDVFDPVLGRVTKIDKTDPRYISGELVPYISESARAKASKNMSEYNKSLKGNVKWMTSPDGKTKMVHIDDIDGYIANGWCLGMKRTKRTVTKPQLGKSWYNDGENSKMFLPNEIPSGWKKGRIQKKRAS